MFKIEHNRSEGVSLFCTTAFVLAIKPLCDIALSARGLSIETLLRWSWRHYRTIRQLHWGTNRGTNSRFGIFFAPLREFPFAWRTRACRAASAENRAMRWNLGLTCKKRERESFQSGRSGFSLAHG